MNLKNTLIAYRGHVAYVAEDGHEHGHPSTGHGRRYGFHQPGDFHGQVVEVISTDQQADAGEKLADDGHQHAGLALMVPVAPRPNEYDQHGRYAALDDRLPYDHVSHQLLDHDLLFRVVHCVPALQRGTSFVVQSQIHPARLLQVQVLRGKGRQHAGHDVTAQHGLHRAVFQHELRLGHDVHRLPCLVVIVRGRRRFFAFRRTRVVRHRHRQLERGVVARFFEREFVCCALTKVNRQ